VSLADFNEMEQAVRLRSTARVYDLDNNGTVNASDLHQLVVQGLGTLPGDTDLNGTVDATDLGVWRASMFQINKTWASGDFNADGVVDGADFNIWNAYKFSGAAQAHAASRATPRAALSASAIDRVMETMHSTEESSHESISSDDHDSQDRSATLTAVNDGARPVVKRIQNGLRLRRNASDVTTRHDMQVVLSLSEFSANRGAMPADLRPSSNRDFAN
jgi:hypothetical protein